MSTEPFIFLKLFFSGGDALSITSLNLIQAGAQSDMELVGMLALSIPMIAYGIVKGGEMAMTSFITGATQPAQSAASAAGMSAGMGNFQYGNTSQNTHSWDTASAFKNDQAPVLNMGAGYFQDAKGMGQWTTGAVKADSTTGASTSTDIVSAQTVKSMAEASKTQYETARKTSEALGVAAGNAESTMLARVTNSMGTTTDGTSGGNTQTVGFGTGNEASKQNSQSFAKANAQQLGVSEEVAQGYYLKAAADAGNKFNETLSKGGDKNAALAAAKTAFQDSFKKVASAGTGVSTGSDYTNMDKIAKSASQNLTESTMASASNVAKDVRSSMSTDDLATKYGFSKTDAAGVNTARQDAAQLSNDYKVADEKSKALKQSWESTEQLQHSLTHDRTKSLSAGQVEQLTRGNQRLIQLNTEMFNTKDSNKLRALSAEYNQTLNSMAVAMNVGAPVMQPTNFDSTNAGDRIALANGEMNAMYNSGTARAQGQYTDDSAKIPVGNQEKKVQFAKEIVQDGLGTQQTTIDQGSGNVSGLNSITNTQFSNTANTVTPTTTAAAKQVGQSFNADESINDKEMLLKQTAAMLGASAAGLTAHMFGRDIKADKLSGDLIRGPELLGHDGHGANGGFGGGKPPHGGGGKGGRTFEGDFHEVKPSEAQKVGGLIAGLAKDYGGAASGHLLTTDALAKRAAGSGMAAVATGPAAGLGVMAFNIYQTGQVLTDAASEVRNAFIQKGVIKEGDDLQTVFGKLTDHYNNNGKR